MDKKTILKLIIIILPLFIITGCVDKDACKAIGTGGIMSGYEFFDVPITDSIEYCKFIKDGSVKRYMDINNQHTKIPSFYECKSMCSVMIDKAFGNINDTWGNDGGFPLEISKALTDCLDKCLNQ